MFLILHDESALNNFNMYGINCERVLLPWKATKNNHYALNTLY